ncbi:MAG TPA: molybdate ABC transporter permease subunit, partial [Mycobacterium sp.]
MTVSVGAVDPNPEAIRPELTGNGGSGRPSRLLDRAHASTSLRVGAATMWLSIIVLLPLAAILWQSAGGGWDAFWSAVTSP